MTDPKPTPDPLEEALIALDERLDESALAAIRVLKRGHAVHGMLGPGCPACLCGCEWPCPVLVEAAKKLRGEE